MAIKILPHEQFFEVHTRMQKSELVRKLRSQVGARRPAFVIGPTNIFVGQVYDTGFDIKEDILLNRTLNPVLHGSFKNADEGVVIHVKASNVLAVVFAIWAWIAWVGVIIGFFVSIIKRDFEASLDLAAVAAIVGSGMIFLSKLYYYRVKESERKIRQLLG